MEESLGLENRFLGQGNNEIELEGPTEELLNDNADRVNKESGNRRRVLGRSPSQLATDFLDEEEEAADSIAASID